MKTNFSIVPRTHVSLKNLKDYTAIKDVFRHNNIDRYLYVIKYKGEMAKCGISHKIQEPGDRIYTQVGHMPGWTKPLLKRSDKKTGKAVREMIAKLNPTSFHKDDVEVEILDFTNYPFKQPTSDKNVYAEMQNAEEELKQEYYQVHGRYPCGNIKQERIRVVAPEEDIWNKLFN